MDAEIAAGSIMAYASVNPFDNKLVRTFEELTDKQLEAKIATATACVRFR